MNSISIGNTLVNNMQNVVDKDSSNQETKTNSFIDELLAMVELSVKTTKLPDGLISGETQQTPAITSENSLLGILPLTNGKTFDLSELGKLKEVAKKIKLANNISQDNNIGNNLILNLNPKNTLFQKIDLDLVKKQNEILDKYGKAELKIDLLEHPKIQLIRETTKDLIAQHREFLQPFKEKLGLISDADLKIGDENIEVSQKIKDLKESNKLFFDGLKSKLNSESSPVQVINDNQNVGSINLKETNAGVKFGMENNNQQSGENSQKYSEQINSKKLIELFMNGKINSDAFNKNLSELKDIANDIKVNAKEYVIYKDVQAKNIMINTANTLGELTPNGSAVIKMNLMPANLGKIFVELSVVNNVATLNFKSESKEAIKLIENQINNLVDKLNNQGINTNSISVSLNSTDEQELHNQNKFFDKNNKEQSQHREYLDTLKNLALLNEIK